MNRWIAALIAVPFILDAAAASAGQLTLGRAHARAGSEVAVPLQYRQQHGAAVVALMTDVDVDPTVVTNARCRSGTAATAAGKTVACSLKGRRLRVLVFGLNTNVIPDGEVASVTFDVSPHARARLYILRQRSTGADATGREFRLAHGNGAVRVGRR